MGVNDIVLLDDWNQSTYIRQPVNIMVLSESHNLYSLALQFLHKRRSHAIEYKNINSILTIVQERNKI